MFTRRTPNGVLQAPSGGSWSLRADRARGCFAPRGRDGGWGPAARAERRRYTLSQEAKTGAVLRQDVSGLQKQHAKLRQPDIRVNR
eukprot:3992544-Pyramimonas_sp.AAC.1